MNFDCLNCGKTITISYTLDTNGTITQITFSIICGHCKAKLEIPRQIQPTPQEVWEKEQKKIKPKYIG